MGPVAADQQDVRCVAPVAGDFPGRRLGQQTSPGLPGLAACGGAHAPAIPLGTRVVDDSLTVKTGT
jgi:hypothetical protein